MIILGKQATSSLTPADLCHPAASSNDRGTNYTYDFRGRQLTLQGEESLFTANTYNNLGQVTQVDRYNGSESAANLIGRRKTFYDDLGRTYRAETYAVTVGTGAVGNHLYSLTWYDPAGNAIKQVEQGAKEGKAFAKMTYDGLGRNTAQYVGYFTGSGQETYAEASAIGSTSKIFEQTYITYDDASNTIATASYQRFHTATGGGELNLPDTIEPKARVSYMASYYDGVGRQTATANYGTNDNVSFTRPGATPAASDDVLVSLTSYNIEGEAYLTTDPASMVTRSDFDDAGRQIRTIQNYVPFGEETAPAEQTATSCPCPTDDDSCLQAGNDENVMVETVYNADGQVSQLIAKNPTTGDQVTQYIYGTTLADSEIARNDLLVAEIYPDAVDSTDRMTYTYDRSGTRTSMTDQNGSVHEYDYDALGRRTADRVTNVATGIDDSVLRIETVYEVRGLVESVTSYDAATSGSVVNQVQYEYNDYGQLITEYEAHDGAVNTGTTPKVQYDYADGSSNTIRSTGFIYPNGNTLTHGYGTGSSDDDLLSRIVDLTHSLSPSDPISYSYFGLSSVYKIDYTEPDVALNYATGSGANPYASLDRFGRVIDMNWENYGTSTSLDHIQYGYDRASNRTWRKNLVAPAGFDELYSYDGMHRLKTANRGQLNDDESRIESNFEFHQAWNLDATGNWSEFEQFDQDDANQALVQQRTHNEVNEIVGIGETVGAEWATPSHDRNGNMTVIPQPKAPTESYDANYDAWNRLITLVDSTTGDMVSVYHYDGVDRRMMTDAYASGIIDQTRHYYYNNQWQSLEERMDASSNAERQYVWGIQYVDQLHLRHRDATGNGTLDEELWAIQDGNWNVIAICKSSGEPFERYTYSPYGERVVRNISFAIQSSSQLDVKYSFIGYYLNSTDVYYTSGKFYVAQLGRVVASLAQEYNLDRIVVDDRPLYYTQPGDQRPNAQLAPDIFPFPDPSTHPEACGATDCVLDATGEGGIRTKFYRQGNCSEPCLRSLVFVHEKEHRKNMGPCCDARNKLAVNVASMAKTLQEYQRFLEAIKKVWAMWKRVNELSLEQRAAAKSCAKAKELNSKVCSRKEPHPNPIFEAAYERCCKTLKTEMPKQCDNADGNAKLSCCPFKANEFDKDCVTKLVGIYKQLP